MGGWAGGYGRVVGGSLLATRLVVVSARSQIKPRPKDDGANGDQDADSSYRKARVAHVVTPRVPFARTSSVIAHGFSSGDGIPCSDRARKAQADPPGAN